jgi:hypothetical protein
MPVVVQQPPPTPPIPPTPEVLQIRPAQGGGVQVSSSSGSPSATYEAFRHQRSELRNQLEHLEDQRDNIAEELRRPTTIDVDRKGLETRITSIDQRIAETEKQIADADASVARAAAVPGAVVPPPPRVERGPPEEFFVLTGLFMFIVILPLTIAYARRIWRRGAAVVSAIPQEIYDRFNRLDQAVDSVAIEVERIGEGQRFMTRTFAEQRGLGAGPAEHIEAAERERERQRRG